MVKVKTEGFAVNHWVTVLSNKQTLTWQLIYLFLKRFAICIIIFLKRDVSDAMGFQPSFLWNCFHNVDFMAAIFKAPYTFVSTYCDQIEFIGATFLLFLAGTYHAMIVT